MSSSEEVNLPPYEATPLYSSAADDRAALGPIVQDLEARLEDWKGWPLSKCGELVLYHPALKVDRRGAADMTIYVFRQVILFTQTRKRGFLQSVRSFFGQGSSSASSPSNSSSKGRVTPSRDDKRSSSQQPDKDSVAKMTLDGRVSLHSVSEVVCEPASEGRFKLEIHLQEGSDRLSEPITLIFTDQPTADKWRDTIDELVHSYDFSFFQHAEVDDHTFLETDPQTPGGDTEITEPTSKV